MGPPEWGLHRIILFFLYSSSLLCSEPTHVFGRTRWLTLANGNQKTRVKVTWLSHTPNVEVPHLAPRSISFSLWRLYPTYQKLEYNLAYLKLDYQVKQQHLLNEKGCTQDCGREEASAFTKAVEPGSLELESGVRWIWVQIQPYHL